MIDRLQNYGIAKIQTTC